MSSGGGFSITRHAHMLRSRRLSSRSASCVCPEGITFHVALDSCGKTGDDNTNLSEKCHSAFGFCGGIVGLTNSRRSDNCQKSATVLAMAASTSEERGQLSCQSLRVGLPIMTTAASRNWEDECAPATTPLLRRRQGRWRGHQVPQYQPVARPLRARLTRRLPTNDRKA